MSEGGNEKTDRKSRVHIPGWKVMVATEPLIIIPQPYPFGIILSEWDERSD